MNTLDARYAGIPLWSDATLEVGVDYAIVRPTDAQDAERSDLKNGVMLTTELTQGLLGGFNKNRCNTVPKATRHSASMAMVAGMVLKLQITALMASVSSTTV